MVRTDASEFDQCLDVDARLVGKHTVFFGKSPVVGNSIAALLMHVQEIQVRFLMPISNGKRAIQSPIFSASCFWEKGMLLRSLMKYYAERSRMFSNVQ